MAIVLLFFRMLSMFVVLIMCNKNISCFFFNSHSDTDMRNTLKAMNIFLCIKTSFRFKLIIKILQLSPIVNICEINSPQFTQLQIHFLKIVIFSMSYIQTYSYQHKHGHMLTSFFSNKLKQNSITTSSSNPRISVILLVIHGLMTSIFTLVKSTLWVNKNNARVNFIHTSYILSFYPFLLPNCPSQPQCRTYSHTQLSVYVQARLYGTLVRIDYCTMAT